MTEPRVRQHASPAEEPLDIHAPHIAQILPHIPAAPRRDAVPARGSRTACGTAMLHCRIPRFQTGDEHEEKEEEAPNPRLGGDRGWVRVPLFATGHLTPSQELR